MKSVETVEDHLVIHDVTSLSVAGVLGLTAAAATGDPAVGFAAAVTVAGAGIGGMRIGPFRRGVNRTVLALSEGSGK